MPERQQEETSDTIKKPQSTHSGFGKVLVFSGALLAAACASTQEPVERPLSEVKVISPDEAGGRTPTVNAESCLACTTDLGGLAYALSRQYPQSWESIFGKTVECLENDQGIDPDGKDVMYDGDKFARFLPLVEKRPEYAPLMVLHLAQDINTLKSKGYLTDGEKKSLAQKQAFLSEYIEKHKNSSDMKEIKAKVAWGNQLTQEICTTLDGISSVMDKELIEAQKKLRLLQGVQEYFDPCTRLKIVLLEVQLKEVLAKQDRYYQIPAFPDVPDVDDKTWFYQYTSPLD